jgi:hypothetical protein
MKLPASDPKEHTIFVKVEGFGQALASAGSAGYWLACAGENDAYQARNIIRAYEEAAPLIEQLRARFDPKSAGQQAA